MPFLLTFGGEIIPISDADAEDLRDANARSFEPVPGSKESGGVWDQIEEMGMDPDDEVFIDPEY